MKIKKILAGVVAGALAVSAMAVNAFAEESKYSLVTTKTTVHHATMTLTKGGSFNGEVEAKKIEFLPPVVGSDFTSDATKVQVESYSVELKVLVGKGTNAKVETLTKTEKDDMSKSISFSLNAGPGFQNFTNVEPNAEWQATCTVKLKSTAKDVLKAMDVGNYVTFNNFNQKAVKMDADTEDSGMDSVVTIGVSGSNATTIITRADARAMTKNGATITLHSWANGSANVLNTMFPYVIPVEITSSINPRNTTTIYSVLQTANGDVTFNIPAGLMNAAGDEAEEFYVLKFDIKSNYESKTEGNNFAQRGFWGGDLVINTDGVPAATTTTGTTAPADDRVISLTASTPNGDVKVSGTMTAIYGNGAQDLKVTNNITNNSVSYDVKLTNAAGAYVQPAGEITLQLSIPSDFRGRQLKSTTIKHTCTDGTVEDLPIVNAGTYVTDGYIIVKTSKFSSFGMEFEESAETTTEVVVTPAPEITTAATTAAPVATGNTNNGSTGDKNVNTGVAIAVVPAIIAAAGVIISKKRK